MLAGAALHDGTVRCAAVGTCIVREYACVMSLLSTGTYTTVNSFDQISSRTIEALQNKPLAFSSDNNLVSASSRSPLGTKDGTLLNIELFFDSETNDDSPILLFTHGVGGSAETLGVQAIVAAAKKYKVKVAVLELEGHGLSSGARMVCGDFDRVLGHVLEFVQHSVPALRGNSNAPFFMTGNSLGGVLSIYAAEEISKKKVAYPSNFKGLATICPAVGVDSNKVPSAPIVLALSILSTIAPSLQISLTPLEDPASYNCPSDSERNFSGHWPLGTSKMLLDVTSTKVKSDVKTRKVSLKSVDNVLVFAGEKDDVVPFDSVKSFHDAISPSGKDFVSVNAGHDMMFFEESAKVVTSALFDWIVSKQ